MALYAIGDLHLHFGSELKVPSQIHDAVWKDHEKRFRENCERMLTGEDTLVLVGDHSWGKNSEECAPDLEYISELPGRKILLRVNHDMFWDVNKTEKLNEQFHGKLEFLQNNFFTYKEYALIGTKGHTFEGPFYLDSYGRIKAWDEKAAQHAEKLVEREYKRLKISYESARSKGFGKFIIFLHYPPTNILQRESAFTKFAEEIGAEHLIYGHCHGESRFHDSIEGSLGGTDYALVSGDYRNWVPYKVME